MPGTVACGVCFGLEFLLILVWRVLLVMRNKRRAKRLEELGISEEERVERGKQLGEQDATDFENIYVSFIVQFGFPKGMLTSLSSSDIPCSLLRGQMCVVLQEVHVSVRIGCRVGPRLACFLDASDPAASPAVDKDV